MNADHDYFMGLALEQARAAMEKGGRPICALIVQNGAVVGQGLNTVAADLDLSAHGEVTAIRDACAKLKTLDLSGSTLYSPMEPCPMCLWTILEARIQRLVLGARHARVRRKDLQLGDYSVESFLALTRRKLNVITGVREAECERLRIAFLRSIGGLA